ncbi:MAG: response regulator [Actinomycetota bacterium]
MWEVVQACLTDLGGWNVRSAHSSLEGLQQAKFYQPDAIILELSFSEVDGLMLLEDLRSNPATQKIPIVILTVRSKWFDLRLLQGYQVAAVIVNPLNLEKLPLQIANVLKWDLDS